MQPFRDETDRLTYRDVQAGLHRPPPWLKPRTILDLGCNAGYTLLDFRELYPEAEIWGAEMDLDNFLVASANVGDDPLTHVFHVAIATENAIAKYDPHVKNNAYRVGGGEQGVRCMKLDSFVENLPVIDFAKIDIEGMEKSIFQAPAEIWPKRILSLNVELHDYEAEEAQADLARLGYISRTGPGTSLFAWR
jgi:FkbM family methyltransferase